MSVRKRTLILGVAATAIGIAIAWVDSQPNWDDTGITGVALAVSAATFAFIARARPWLWALLVGMWVPAMEFTHPNGLYSILGLVFAVIGAAVGYFAARSLPPRAQASRER